MNSKKFTKCFSVAILVVLLGSSAVCAENQAISAEVQAQTEMATVVNSDAVEVAQNAAMPATELNPSAAAQNNTAIADKGIEKKSVDGMSDFAPLTIIFLLLAMIGLYMIYSGKKVMKVKDGHLVEEEPTVKK